MWARHGTILAPDPAATYPITQTYDHVEITWENHLGTDSMEDAIYPFLALGGDMYAKAGQFSLDSDGTTTVTGLGFRPQAILFATNRQASEYGSTPGGLDVTLCLGMGMTDGTTQVSIGGAQVYLSANNQREGRMQTDACIFRMDTGGIVWKASISSLDSDGFTLTNDSTTESVAYLALASVSGQFKVGTGTQSDTSVAPGFRATGLLTLSHGGTATNTQESDFNFMCGVASDSPQVDSDPWCGQWNHTDGSDTDARASLVNDAVVSFIDESGGWSVKAQATVTSWGGTIGLNWTVDDSADRLFGWLAFRKTQADRGDQPVALIVPHHVDTTAASDVIDTLGQVSLGFASSTTDDVSIGLRDNRGGVGELNVVSADTAGLSMYFAGADTRFHLGSNGPFVAAFVPQIYRFT